MRSFTYQGKDIAMSADLPAAVLDRVDETRRAFLNRMLAATPFMVPAVASYTIASLTADEAAAQTLSTKVSTTGPKAVPASSSVGLVAAAAGLLLSGLAVLQHHRGQQPDNHKAE
jgi:hypothetical protein